MFIKYPKVKRLGHEDVIGILEGTVHIQEKVDGANASIWMENGEIKCGSRTRILTEGFNGFVDYAKNHLGIKRFLEENPNMRLYGEWLVRHTISYNETAYKNFYLFDILVKPPGEIEVPENTEETSEMKKKKREEHIARDIVRQCKFLTTDEVQEIAKHYGITAVHIFATLESPRVEEIEEYVGKTVLGEKGEGVVIKNKDFINKWGDRVCAKMVTQAFKEDNGIVFGGNNKHSDTYVEMKLVNKAMTAARIRKVMNKLQPLVEEKLDVEHTARVIQTAYKDMFEEELWEFTKKNKQINFTNLQKLACKKAARIYHDILSGDISVAY